VETVAAAIHAESDGARRRFGGHDSGRVQERAGRSASFGPLFIWKMLSFWLVGEETRVPGRGQLPWKHPDFARGTVEPTVKKKRRRT